MSSNSGDGKSAPSASELAKFIPAVAFGLSLAVAGIGGIANDPDLGPPVYAHLVEWKWFYIAGFIALLGVIVFIWQFRRRDETIRALLIVCVVVPLLVGVILAIVLMPLRWQEGITRLVFVLIAAILPAAMYYLFLAAKRPSLFEEYVANLRRLGLIHAGMDQVDLDAYLQKFEASFGGIPESGRERLISLIRKETGRAGTPEEIRGTGGRLGQLVAFQAANLLSPSVLLPLALSTILIGVGWLLVLPPLLPEGAHDGAIAGKLMLFPGVTPVSFAFLGAYFFSLQMLFRRFVLNDLRPSAYIAVGQRIVLSIIAVWVLLAIADANLLDGLNLTSAEPSSVTNAADTTTDTSAGTGAAVASSITPTIMALAFLIGVFPGILWDFMLVALAKVTFAERYFRKMTPEMPLSLLDGLTIFHESRLEEEDIENVPNMATVDIVQMMLSTRFAPNRVIDWVDQAILYTALGPEGGPDAKDTQRGKLRHQGIRTASALIVAYEKAVPGAAAANQQPAAPSKADFDALLAILEGPGRSPMRTLVDTLKTNPNLYLVMCWQSQTAGEPQEPGENLAEESAGEPQATVPVPDEVGAEAALLASAG